MSLLDDDVPYQIIKSISDFRYINDIKPAPYELVFQANAIPPLGFKLFFVQNLPTSNNNKVFVDDTSDKYKLGDEVDT